MTGASLGVAVIGKSLAQARGLLPKHAVKQVDRLLSNRKLEAVFATWVPELVGSRTDLTVAAKVGTTASESERTQHPRRLRNPLLRSADLSH